MRRRPTAAPRQLALLGLALATLAGACARGRRGGAPRTTPTPATPTARADSAARRADSLALRDSAVRADSTKRVAVDTGRPAARPRRAEPDPAARCGTITLNAVPGERPNATVNSSQVAEGKYITYIGQGVTARCVGTGIVLRADSAEQYPAPNEQLVLIGNVDYTEARRARMTSQRLTYFTNDERLIADGNVVVTLPSGTTMTGPNVEYLRAVARVRPSARLTAVGRPTVTVKGSGETRAPGAARAERDTSTTTIVANTIVNEADSIVFASGQVVITRTDVVATSDSATYDQGSERARLLRNAAIRGVRGRPFTLSGARIDLFARERQLTRVVSRDSAHVVSEQLDLRSDTVDMRLVSGEIDRAFAWGPSRAVATSPERDVVADSIAAYLPARRIRELHAVRRAVARSVPDTARIASKERDMLAGDTIHAYFDTLAAARDTTKNPPVRRILASGNAASLYQIASQQGRTAPPSINYVRGRLITVDFDTGQVQTVTVTDKATGVYLEPADSASDSTGARRPAAPATPGLPRPTPPRPGAPPAVRDDALAPDRPATRAGAATPR